jgi:hypothetical protein
MNVEIGTEAEQFSFLGIHKWDFRCSVGAPQALQCSPPSTPTTAKPPPCGRTQQQPSPAQHTAPLLGTTTMSIRLTTGVQLNLTSHTFPSGYSPSIPLFLESPSGFLNEYITITVLPLFRAEQVDSKTYLLFKLFVVLG